MNTTKEHSEQRSSMSPSSPFPLLLEQSDPNPYELVVGSKVQYGSPLQYGVIKWIGTLEEQLYAGVEMVSYII